MSDPRNEFSQLTEIWQNEAAQREIERWADAAQVERIRRWHALDDETRAERRQRARLALHAHHHV